MNKLPRAFAVVLLFCASACQKRTLCKEKTSSGGTVFTRVYPNNYDSQEDYNTAIANLKTQGYTCDDSSAVFI